MSPSCPTGQHTPFVATTPVFCLYPAAAVTDPLEEVFSLLVALVGLAGFALALALVEQIVLETNLANVSRGSRVYESGHVSVSCCPAGRENI